MQRRRIIDRWLDRIVGDSYKPLYIYFYIILIYKPIILFEIRIYIERARGSGDAFFVFT